MERTNSHRTNTQVLANQNTNPAQTNGPGGGPKPLEQNQRQNLQATRQRAPQPNSKPLRTREASVQASGKLSEKTERNLRTVEESDTIKREYMAHTDGEELNKLAPLMRGVNRAVGGRSNPAPPNPNRKTISLDDAIARLEKSHQALDAASKLDACSPGETLAAVGVADECNRLLTQLKALKAKQANANDAGEGGRPNPRVQNNNQVNNPNTNLNANLNNSQVGNRANNDLNAPRVDHERFVDDELIIQTAPPRNRPNSLRRSVSDSRQMDLEELFVVDEDPTNGPDAVQNRDDKIIFVAPDTPATSSAKQSDGVDFVALEDSSEPRINIVEPNLGEYFNGVVYSSYPTVDPSDVENLRPTTAVIQENRDASPQEGGSHWEFFSKTAGGIFKFIAECANGRRVTAGLDPQSEAIAGACNDIQNLSKSSLMALIDEKSFEKKWASAGEDVNNRALVFGVAAQSVSRIELLLKELGPIRSEGVLANGYGLQPRKRGEEILSAIDKFKIKTDVLLNVFKNENDFPKQYHKDITAYRAVLEKLRAAFDMETGSLVMLKNLAEDLVKFGGLAPPPADVLPPPDVPIGPAQAAPIADVPPPMDVPPPPPINAKPSSKPITGANVNARVQQAQKKQPTAQEIDDAQRVQKALGQDDLSLGVTYSNLKTASAPPPPPPPIVNSSNISSSSNGIGAAALQNAAANLKKPKPSAQSAGGSEASASNEDQIRAGITRRRPNLDGEDSDDEDWNVPIDTN